jgi:hypothetical protein
MQCQLSLRVFERVDVTTRATRHACMSLLVPGRISPHCDSSIEQDSFAMTRVEPVEGLCMGVLKRQFLWDRLRIASTKAHLMWSESNDPLSFLL